MFDSVLPDGDDPGDPVGRPEGDCGPPAPGAFLGWVEKPPSADMLTALLACDPSELPRASALTYLELLDRCMAMLHSLQARALVSAAGPSVAVTKCTAARGTVSVDLADVVREEVAAALRLAPGTAQTRIDRARLLAGPLGRTWDALATAEITYGHAAVIADIADRMSSAWSADPEARAHFERACAALEDRVLPVARRGTVGQARGAAERALLALDADAITAQRRRQQLDADVQVFDEPAGMSTLWARLTTEMAHACMASIYTYAASPRLPMPEGAGAGARRAFALASLLTQPDLPSAEGGEPLQVRPAVHLDVTISAASLLGLSEEPAEILAAGSSVPAVVPACAIRELAALEGIDRLTWRRLVLDPMTGHLLDRGREAYQVGARMRDWIVARDRTCRFPGCSRPAIRCEIDHAEPWDAGGRTDRGNLGALCKRHHLIKTHAAWSIEESREDGSCTWRSPLGHQYHRDVEPLPGAPPGEIP